MKTSEAIRKLGRPIAFYPWIAKIVGIKPALLLCQLLYWTGKENNERGDGWIYKSVPEVEEETCLTYKEQQKAREYLEEMGLIQCDYERQNHKLWFRVNTEACDNLSDGHLTKGQMVSAQKSDGILPKVSSFYSENTTETTAETTAVIEPEPEPEPEPTPEPEITPELEQEEKYISDRELVDLWKSMRVVYRAVGKSLGSVPKGTLGERYRDSVTRYGQEKFYAAFAAFVDNKGKYLKTLSTPMFLFLKEVEDWVEDVSITIEEPKPEQVAGPRGVSKEYQHLVKPEFRD